MGYRWGTDGGGFRGYNTHIKVQEKYVRNPCFFLRLKSLRSSSNLLFLTSSEQSIIRRGLESKMSGSPSNKSQLAQDLPGITINITDHDDSGKETFLPARAGEWQAYDNKGMAFSVLYTTSEFPVSLNNHEDLIRHDKTVASNKLGLMNPGGIVWRMVDFAPGFESMMHRTRSLDFGIVIEGTIELILESGEKRVLRRGDVSVQRGTNHAWRNPDPIQWCRMAYVLQDSQPVLINGKPLEEDLGRSAGEVPPSDRDI